jgi:hypothetical protein
MAKEQINYKEWCIDLCIEGSGWKALIYRPHSVLHEETIPTGQDRHAVIEKAKNLIDDWLER